ncbi:hypothetical protein MJO48_16310 [Dickeya fangzhongdai]|uniref:hypothetical protein n=1 Tax=Dickeya fangzhongdai TaxID=1778540 RepID=UPI001EFB00F4|nr:hypothetical protein [Dickeya fangzhongdai]ULR30030.1 hypothetical protein MJO48_16310 [Dickeya fangzhongdai]
MEKLKNKIFRLTEEILPFIYFLCINNSRSKKLHDIDFSTFQYYLKLPNEVLEQRLKDEHDRAVKIDDKTSKFTLGLSISLTIISATTSSIVKTLPNNQLNNWISFLFGLSSLYMLSGGLLALGTLKTLPRFGYGTTFEIDKNSETLINSLIKQEKINILRHIRNELSYMSLRNGFILMLIALSLNTIILFKQTIPIFYENEIIMKYTPSYLI